MSIEDIPEIPDREERLEEILVDCNGQGEELSAFEVYFFRCDGNTFRGNLARPR